MSDIQIKAKELLDQLIILRKPICYNKKLKGLYDEYWSLHSITICRNELVRDIKNRIQDLELEATVDPTVAYLLVGRIDEQKRLVSELNKM